MGGSKGGSSQQVTRQSSDISKDLRPYRKEILDAAQDLFQGGAPEYISTYVPPSVQSISSLNMMEDAARNFQPFLQTAEETFMQNLTGTNPIYDTVFKRMAQEATNPYATGGRYGSGYQQAAVTEALAPTIANVQSNALASLPNLYAMQMLPAETMMQVGAGRELIDQMALEEEARQAQYPYASEYGLLTDYANIFGGLPLGSEGQTVTPINKPSRLGQLASIGLQAAGIAGGASSGSLLTQMIMGAGSGGATS